MSSSRNSTSSKNVQQHHQSPLINGSSSSSTKMMMDYQRTNNNHHHSNNNSDYMNDPTGGVMFHRSNSSRVSKSTSSSSASSSPSLSLARDGGVVLGSNGGPAAPSTGRSTNLVKQMVDNLYTNAVVNSQKNANAVNSSTSPNHNLVNSTSASSIRSSFRNGPNGAVPQPPQPMSPSTQQRMFPLKSQFSEPSGHHHNHHHHQHQPSYDNLSPAPGFRNSPSLDRKSVTRASLPVGGSAAHLHHHNHNNNHNNNNSSPYYVRTGSGMSSASSTTSGGPQLYGQINQSSSKTSVKSYLDGDLIPEPGTPPGGAGGSSTQNGNTNHYGTSTWVEILEPRTRTKMFANLSTGECRWDEPKGVPILRATNPNITQWWELYDTKTQRFYYYSAKDFKTIWQKPTSPDAVVVPLAKLQIMKQNSSHGHGPHGAHLNESFDSGTGGGGSSSGHVTPSSPSLSSPSHLFPSGSQRFKGWSGPNGPFGPIHSPVTPPVADACTQTQNPVTSKPTMVSRWTQTTNITPTHVKIPRGRLDQANGHQLQVNHHQSALYAASSQQHQQQHPQNYHRPSLQNYLLSEKRFAKGRYSIPVQGTGEELYDQVYGSGSGQNQNHLVYGNASDFYDQVAQDNQINHAHARNGFYEDVYDGYYGDEMLDYFDEDEDEDEDEFDDESDGDEDFDADDEFGGESVDEDDDEDEEEEEEEDECDFDDSSEDDFVDGQKLARPYVRRPQQAQPNLPEESEVYSAQSEFTGDFVRGHQHRQPLQVATTNKTTVKIVSSTRVPTNDATNKAVAMNQQQQNQAHAQQQQQQQQNDGIRMSASFTAVDFKRNAVGRSSYTPSLHHHYNQQQQQNPSNSVSNVPNQSSSQQQAPPQQQSYSNPFNSGSLRSSTGRIPSNATASGVNVPVASSGSVRTSGGNIADRINLFQSKLSTGGQASLGQAPSPVIIHRTPSSPPGVQLVQQQQQQTSTPLPVAQNSTTTRHSSGNDSATSNNLHRYFSSQQQQNNNQPQPQQQQQQNQPSKSHSMTQITPNSGLNGAATPTASNVSKLSSNFSNLNVSSSSKSQSPNSDTYYHIPPSSSTEALPGTGTPQISKRNFMGSSGMTKNSSGNMDSTLEQGRHRTLSNTLGHSLSVSGSGTNTSGPLSITSPSGQSGAIQISSSTSSIYNRSSNSGTSFPNFNDSHLVMLNKSQSVAITPTSAGHGIGRGGSDPKNNNNNNKNNKTKDNNKSNNNKSNNKENIKGPKSKESKLISGSPKKKKDIAGGGTAPPSNTSIESFAKECVSRHRKGGIFSKKKTLKSMLTHTKKPLKKPMISTISDSLLVKESVNCFKLIQIFMRDRVPSPAPGAEEPSTTTETTTSSLPEALLSDEQILVRLISVCVQLVPLRDEVLVQVARQVTQNPSPDSEQRGLELLCALFWYFTASNKLGSHLHAFLAGHRNPFTVVVRRKFEQQMHRARHTHSHLFFRKPHSPEEVARVLRCVRAKHAGLFGETLTDGIVPGESDPKKQQLPWPVVLLTEALLEPRHEDREGVFRCVGDMDDVHKLKMKIDTTLPTDAHFPELIGRGPGGSKIPKLTDVHDLHVIASTLKLYFRELRDAVIPADLYLEALECAHSPARACGLLDKLPMVNRAALCYIIRFLQVFSAPDHVRDTKMDDANLSMVWAPNILRSLTPSPAGPNGVLLAAAAAAANNIYEQTRAEMSLVRTLIQHLDTNNAMVQ